MLAYGSTYSDILWKIIEFAKGRSIKLTAVKECSGSDILRNDAMWSEFKVFTFFEKDHEVKSKRRGLVPCVGKDSIPKAASFYVTRW